VLGTREVFGCGCNRAGKSSTFNTKFDGRGVVIVRGAVGDGWCVRWCLVRLIWVKYCVIGQDGGFGRGFMGRGVPWPAREEDLFSWGCHYGSLFWLLVHRH
jgi:hypothetical protein